MHIHISAAWLSSSPRARNNIHLLLFPPLHRDLRMRKMTLLSLLRLLLVYLLLHYYTVQATLSLRLFFCLGKCLRRSNLGHPFLADQHDDDGGSTRDGDNGTEMRGGFGWMELLHETDALQISSWVFLFALSFFQKANIRLTPCCLFTRCKGEKSVRPRHSSPSSLGRRRRW